MEIVCAACFVLGIAIGVFVNRLIPARKQPDAPVPYDPGYDPANPINGKDDEVWISEYGTVYRRVRPYGQ